MISSFGFVENPMNQFIDQKVSGSITCFLVLYMDDILLTTNDKGMPHGVKQFLSKNIDMKDMGEASYVIGIKIHKDRSHGILCLSCCFTRHFLDFHHIVKVKQEKNTNKCHKGWSFYSPEFQT